MRSLLAPGLASLVFEAKSLLMASTNPMSNPPAVGAGYNAARKGSNGAVPGGTPGDAPADVPVDTPFDTAIVPGGQVEPSEVSSPIESPRWTPESLMNSYSSPTNDEMMNSHLNLMKENEKRE